MEVVAAEPDVPGGLDGLEVPVVVAPGALYAPAVDVEPHEMQVLDVVGAPDLL